MTKERLHEDLRQLRYYYSNRKRFEELEEELELTRLKNLATKYARAVDSLEPRLINLYYALYIEGFSQRELAEEWKCTYENIRKTHDKFKYELLIALINMKNTYFD